MLMLGDPMDSEEGVALGLLDFPLPAMATPMPAAAATPTRMNHFAFPPLCTDCPGDALVTETEGSGFDTAAGAERGLTGVLESAEGLLAGGVSGTPGWTGGAGAVFGGAPLALKFCSMRRPAWLVPLVAVMRIAIGPAVSPQ